MGFQLLWPVSQVDGRAASGGAAGPPGRSNSPVFPQGFRLSRGQTADPAAEEENIWNHVLSGSFARTVAQVLVHPIDTIKTRLQVSEPPKKLKRWRKKLAKPKNQVTIPVTWSRSGSGRSITVKNFAFKGPKDLYRGVCGALLGTLPTSLVYFFVYDTVKARLEKIVPDDKPALIHLGSASAGAITSSLLRVPGDTIRHQTQAYMHPNVLQAAKNIITANGPRGLYRGYLPTLLRDVPEMAVQFTVYEQLRKLVSRRRGQAKLYTWEHLVLGGVAGAVAASCTMPMDFVKTRQQCGQNMGVLSLVQSVYKSDGLRGLFAGLGPRVCHVALTSATFFALFEYSKLLLKPDRTPSDIKLLPKLTRKRREYVWKRQFVVE